MTVGASCRPAVQNLVLAAGLQGSMEPDIIALPLPALTAIGETVMLLALSLHRYCNIY